MFELARVDECEGLAASQVALEAPAPVAWTDNFLMRVAAAPSPEFAALNSSRLTRAQRGIAVRIGCRRPNRG